MAAVRLPTLVYYKILVEKVPNISLPKEELCVRFPKRSRKLSCSFEVSGADMVINTIIKRETKATVITITAAFVSVQTHTRVTSCIVLSSLKP